MRSHFVVGARPGRRDRAAEKLLTTSWESSRIHFIIWQDVMEKIYKISWCCRFRRASKWKSICHGSHQLEVLFLPWPWWSIFHAYTSTWLSAANQISFLLARCDVIVTTSGRRFTPSDSWCLSGNKTGESSSRRCWKLFNEFTNRLIVDEIFWSRLMNFSIRFLQVFYVSSSEHDISCSPNWPLALTRVHSPISRNFDAKFSPSRCATFQIRSETSGIFELVRENFDFLSRRWTKTFLRT